MIITTQQLHLRCAIAHACARIGDVFSPTLRRTWGVVVGVRFLRRRVAEHACPSPKTESLEKMHARVHCIATNYNVATGKRCVLPHASASRRELTRRHREEIEKAAHLAVRLHYVQDGGSMCD